MLEEMLEEKWQGKGHTEAPAGTDKQSSAWSLASGHFCSVTCFSNSPAFPSVISGFRYDLADLPAPYLLQTPHSNLRLYKLNFGVTYSSSNCFFLPYPSSGISDKYDRKFIPNLAACIPVPFFTLRAAASHTWTHKSTPSCIFRDPINHIKYQLRRTQHKRVPCSTTNRLNHTLSRRGNHSLLQVERYRTILLTQEVGSRDITIRFIGRRGKHDGAR
ncbi:uncharacterized protein BDV17DRAFT_17986 [Aspergillus undulatus]|uniref:uncharacterized protein n=1 Tax=Aspergillus undulatus TaxID=1810928 RepID=UPI003CCCE59A